MDELDNVLRKMAPISSERSEVKKIEAIKLGYRQTSAGNVISFRLHPDDDTRAIADMPLGSRVLLAIAEVIE